MAYAPYQHSTTTGFANDSMLRRLQASEVERQRLLAEFKDLSVRSDAEIKDLRGSNHFLRSELEASRELCKALEEKNRHIAYTVTEWQKFGQHVSAVMQSEVEECQRKCRDLEMKQAEILRENSELKELCLYLNAEREQALSMSLPESNITRECGDGSSSPLVEKPKVVSEDFRGGVGEKKPSDLMPLPIDEMKQYVRFLEMRVTRLEEANQQLTAISERRRGTSLQRSHSTNLREEPLRAFAVVAEPPKKLAVKQKIDQSASGFNILV